MMPSDSMVQADSANLDKLINLSYFSFLICKMEILVMLTTQDRVQIKWDSEVWYMVEFQQLTEKHLNKTMISYVALF